jgi:hypothetical protein
MREDGVGGYARVDITKPRLAATKDALDQEIERQRGERTRLHVRVAGKPAESVPSSIDRTTPIAADRIPAPVAVHQYQSRKRWHRTRAASPLIALRAVARLYQRRMDRELEESYRQSRWELVA